MTPTTLLRAQGSPATWLLNATKDHRPDQPGEYRYLVDHVNTSIVADLAMLALEGWTVRVNRGPNGKLRITVQRPDAGGVHASGRASTVRSSGSGALPPVSQAPSRVRAREEVARG